MAVYDGGVHAHAEAQGSIIHYLGAVAALAIIGGISVWSYDLIRRDVSGIPVVRSLEGDMRVLPDSPGGEVANHRGLAVNEIAGDGAISEISDTLLLAPISSDLAEEDLIVSPTAEADEVRPLATADNTPTVEPATLETDAAELAIAEALGSDPATLDGTTDIDRLADQIAAGAAPLTDLAAGETVPPVLSVSTPAVSIIPASVPGVSQSLRPVARPAEVPTQVVQAVFQTPTVKPNPRPAAVAPVNIPVGTNLVQLGAFPTENDAKAAWTELKGRFGDYLVSKQQVIQMADRSGSTFYRLRAMGFEDLSDARRFCAALEAGNADCIPVVVR